MVRVCEKPECFNQLEGDFIYFEGYCDFPYVYGAVSFNGKIGYLHLEVIKWSHNILKRMIVDWDIFKNIIKKNGVKHLIITKKGTLSENRGYVKFLSKMGLSSPQEILIGEYEI